MTRPPGFGRALFWALVLAAVPALWLWGIATTPLATHADILRHTEPIGAIWAEQSVGQSFRAEYNGLHRVEVSLADYGRRNTGPVRYRLYALGATQPLRAGEFPAEAIQGDITYPLDFPPVPDSAEHSYYLELTAPAASPDNAITAYWQPQDTYLPGSAYLAGQPRSGDLVFSLYYQVAPWERLLVLFRQVTANKPGVWGQVWPYVAAPLLYLGTLAAVAWVLQQPAGDDAAPPPA